ncbi:lysylphosphatidylglycerol synthase transmembrane domain-containing protein [Ureaplasma urealyticum]|uniref:UPF0104 family protein n=3 Tax=Ureaplasma urealyticum TaxID=2130 RepID=A0AAP9ACP1_UREUR|nr:YbhN family protein [Ureaplasma urealyticum]EDX53748.1 putative membrane protein [Ureaplasma urealyticum serovar 9 str. ATCC 33175]ACI60347.1 putative membrane protein [Ureaplasma urealyticum serovar 10 str. ATCC 33699]EDT49377.1 putative membrane protein [Ureaplasma urealyticum serovar 13 str. ATCC 33698]EDU06201.1 putative membrane protein [Ureaplasma urealyticum serovar 5 str. ATCC 27817]EDU57190.1 putative membrane protein [Ureaplasma urealyticum serovar 7 str. ATCC 27819]
MADNNLSEKTNFWTKKNICFLSIGLLVCLLMIIVSILFILDIDFHNLFMKISNSLKTIKLAVLWLLILIGFSFFRAFMFTIIAVFDAYKNQVKIDWWKWILYSFSLIFLNAVTPFSVGSEPFSIYFLNKNGYHNLKKVSALLLVSSTFYELGQVIVTIPSFIYVNYELITYAVENKTALPFYYYLAVVGVIVDLCMTGVYFILGFSKKLHFNLALVFNWVKKILKFKYLSKAELIQKSDENTSFKAIYLIYFKNLRVSLVAFIIGIVYNVAIYALMYISYRLIESNPHNVFFDLFNYTNVAVTATNFVPLPGSEGSIQYMLRIFLANDQHQIRYAMNYLSTQDVNNIIFIWRAFSIYLGSFIGMFGFGYFLVTDLYKFIKKAKVNKKISKS